ncbi:hypothetical protein [Methylobacterium sp. CM6257]|jgi:hypothetical protein
MRNHRAVRITALLLAAGPTLAPAVAADWPRERHAPRIVRYRGPVRTLPAVPPPVLVQGYLPRNHNVPMYNEPPRRGPAW